MRTLLLILMTTALMSLSAQTVPDQLTAVDLNRMAARFAPTELRVDVSKLSAADRKALPPLIEAARILNTIYMEQLWSGDLALWKKLQQDTSPLGRARAHYFWINKGPWSDIDDFR